MKIKKTIPALSIITLFLCMPAFSFAPGDAPMIKYSTPKVRLWTDIGKEGAQEVIDEIEFFNAHADDFFRSFGITDKKNNPIRIHLYKNNEDFEDMSRRENVGRSSTGAYFSMSNNRIVASHMQGAKTARFGLLHEVSRQLVLRYFSNPPPAWFSEGFASYLAALEFDDNGNLISACGEFSYIRYSADRINFDAFLDDRPSVYTIHSGRNYTNWADASSAWRILYFYHHSKNEDTKKFFKKFIQGMNTGRERSKDMVADIKEREKEFYGFFRRDHQRVYKLYQDALRKKKAGLHGEAVKAAKKIYLLDKEHVAGLRLGAEAAWDGKKYSSSLIFWRLLAELDPKEPLYQWKICWCLTETALISRNKNSVEEAIKIGKKAVSRTSARNPDCLAALALAQHASGDVKGALTTIRKATYLTGPSHQQYKAMEKAYSQELLDR